jgi:hypothetical protein
MSLRVSKALNVPDVGKRAIEERAAARPTAFYAQRGGPAKAETEYRAAIRLAPRAALSRARLSNSRLRQDRLLPVVLIDRIR